MNEVINWVLPKDFQLSVIALDYMSRPEFKRAMRRSFAIIDN